MSVEKLKKVINYLDELKEIIGSHGIFKTMCASSILLLCLTYPFYLPYLRTLLSRAKSQESDQKGDNLANEENNSGRNPVTSTTENQTDDSRVEQERMNRNMNQDDAMETDTVDNVGQGGSSQIKKNQKKNEKEGEDVPKHSTTYNNSEVGMHNEGVTNFHTPVNFHFGKKSKEEKN